jgi:hypothetical protein
MLQGLPPPLEQTSTSLVIVSLNTNTEGEACASIRIPSSWFSLLCPNSIGYGEQLKHIFHDHFYSLDNELKVSELTSI